MAQVVVNEVFRPLEYSIVYESFQIANPSHANIPKYRNQIPISNEQFIWNDFSVSRCQPSALKEQKLIWLLFIMWSFVSITSEC